MSVSKKRIFLAAILALSAGCCPLIMKRLLSRECDPAPEPLAEVPAENQALHIAIAKGYLRGLPGSANFSRTFQLKVDGNLAWEGSLVFGNENGPSTSDYIWLPEPILAPLGAHEFRIYDVTLGSEIAGTYACAHPQCWVVVSYASDINRLDLIEFLSERP